MHPFSVLMSGAKTYFFGSVGDADLRMFDCGIRVKNAIKINFITAVTNYLHY